jgi:hypothetical protein
MATVLLLASTAVAADPPAFRFARPVVPGGVGPNRLELDVPLLTGASRLRFDVGGRWTGGLDDLRLFGADGNELPYLVIAPPDPERRWQAGRIDPIVPTKETSGCEVDLGAVVRVDRLRLAGLTAPFSKRARVEGSGDRVRWVLLVQETTVFDLPEDKLRRTDVTFEASSVRYLRITWDDRASARLPLPGAASVALVTDVVVPPPVLVPLGFERRASEPGTSRFRLRLPGPGLPIRAFELDVGGDRLLRPARVTEPALSGDAMTPRSLGQATLRRVARDDVVAADLRIPVSTPHEVELELVVDDEDNPPLQLHGVRAELPPLPWIYFESRDGAGLSAKFGADLPAPRYDLEAARGALRTAKTLDATWAERTELPEPPRPADAARDDVAAAGAPVDLAAFRWVRDLPPGPPGLTALRLDAAVLAHSPGLGDVRLVAGDGRQIPYVVEQVGEPLGLDLAPPSVEPKGDVTRERQTTYRIELPYPRLPEARLVLETDGRVFERQVALRVERTRPDARDGRRYEVVHTTTWRHVDTERPARPLTIALPLLDVTTVFVDVDDGDNSPLRVASARLLLPTRRLRFVRASGVEPVLVYGAPKLSAPRYDLSLLAPRILGASAHETDPLPERPTGNGAADERGDTVGRGVFWGVLAASVLVLLVVLARLIRVDERADAT